MSNGFLLLKAAVHRIELLKKEIIG